ncbi:hypothetical protein [Falsiroseomonas sp. CW058]|uniref:hypothetical protein n=1 Tax=Falsiroseomonas sp. CW058 TaxID=3388664 RepID=UPI003D31E0B8
MRPVEDRLGRHWDCRFAEASGGDPQCSLAWALKHELRLLAGRNPPPRTVAVGRFARRARAAAGPRLLSRPSDVHGRCSGLRARCRSGERGATTLLGFMPLSAPHDLAGLIAWSRRPEWREPFGTLLNRHVGEACAAAGIPPADIGEVLGDGAVSTVFGAVFEDLLGLTLPDGRNLADEYLRRRGWKEGVGTRDYIAALRRTPMSLFEVSGIVPGESMMLRDLVRVGDPVRVMEKSGSRGARQWDRLATRLIRQGDRAVISGALMVFDFDTSEALLKALRGTLARAPGEAAALARELGVAVDEAAVGAVADVELVLAGAGFLFTAFWLDAALKAALRPSRPEVTNSAGEKLAFVTVHFPLAADVRLDAVRAALAKVPGLRQENAGFWNWVEEKAAPPARRKPRTQSFVTTMDDGAVVLGNLELKARRLSLTANSEARAERGRALLAGALGALVGPPLVERADLDRLLAERHERPRQPASLPPEVEREVIARALDDHYRQVLDEPILSLSNRSPRTAVKTAKGREKVAAWLKLLENHGARREPGDPMAAYDFGWMWRELGVEDLRR